MLSSTPPYCTIHSCNRHLTTHFLIVPNSIVKPINFKNYTILYYKNQETYVLLMYLILINTRCLQQHITYRLTIEKVELVIKNQNHVILFENNLLR